ncbi:MAG: polyprenyl synthetase family protein, partial [Saprospiraceae bacterium]
MAKIAPFQDIIRTYSEYSNAIHWNKEPKELYEPFEYIMKQQGKKLRPLSLLLSYNLFENNLHPALDAAYGIE